jgi:hypothetical protein
MHEPHKHEPRKQYNRDRADSVIHREPLYALGRGGPMHYPVRIMEGRYKQVVALQNINEPKNHDGKQPMNKEFLGYGDVHLHDFHIGAGQSFTEHGVEKLVKASEILADAVERDIPTAITCDAGNKRTARALYLTYRRLGATHEEAARTDGLPASEAERLKEIYEKHIAKK